MTRDEKERMRQVVTNHVRAVNEGEVGALRPIPVTRLVKENPPTPSARVSNLHRHLAWLLVRHQQSAGAARNLRAAANSQDSALVADHKRKAADNAAVNAAHYHEIREAFLSIERARKVLDTELARAYADSINVATQLVKENAARRRFVEAVDRVLGFGAG